MQTNWICEKCGLSGSVPMSDNMDAWGAYILVKEDHAKVSSKCEFDRFKVRVSIVTGEKKE